MIVNVRDTYTSNVYALHHQLSFINHLSSILLQKRGENIELITSAPRRRTQSMTPAFANLTRAVHLVKVECLLFGVRGQPLRTPNVTEFHGVKGVSQSA